MKFLNTKEIGFDYHSIGFPSVKTCQAIVYQTRLGLFGYHDSLGTDAGFTQKCIALRKFVQNLSIDHERDALCLIGAITREERFPRGQEGAWQAQLVEVANHLNFNGDIWGLRLDTHVKDGDSAYIRFDLANGRTPPVKISFKRWSKMGYDNGTTLDNNLNQFGMMQPRQLNKFLTQEEVGGMSSDELQQAYDNVPFDVVMPPLASHPVRRLGQVGEGQLNVARNLVQFR